MLVVVVDVVVVVLVGGGVVVLVLVVVVGVVVGVVVVVVGAVVGVIVAVVVSPLPESDAMTTTATIRPITAAASSASVHLTPRLMPPSGGCPGGGGGSGWPMWRVGSSCIARRVYGPVRSGSLCRGASPLPHRLPAVRGRAG